MVETGDQILVQKRDRNPDSENEIPNTVKKPKIDDEDDSKENHQSIINCSAEDSIALVLEPTQTGFEQVNSEKSESPPLMRLEDSDSLSQDVSSTGTSLGPCEVIIEEPCKTPKNSQGLIVLSDDDGSGTAGNTSSKEISSVNKKKRRLTDDEKMIRQEAKERKEKERAEKEAQRLAAKKAKEEEAEKKRLERERVQKERDEAKKKAEEQKRQKEEERLRQKREKEEQQRLLDEAKAQKKKELEEQKRKKEEEAQQKREEWERKKEELEKKRKEEEERKEQKRREEEEKELKKRKMSENFKKFFKKSDKQTESPLSRPFSIFENALFKPFEVKDGMTLAPIFIREPLLPEIYENLLNIQDEKSDYFATLPKRKCIKSSQFKAKLYQFHDSYRPPYYGTWRKKSKFITGRRPFNMDDERLNYEYDSDEEWQNEPSDAEDVNSEDEPEPEDEERDSENDDGFFVPHGYISEGEGSSDEEVAIREDPESRKKRLEDLDAEFKETMQIKSKRAKKKQLTPRILGPYWGEVDPMTVTEEDIMKNFMPGVLFIYSDKEQQN
uniref:Chromatin assembly factor 1 subunit A n=1 Tax=Acrobeloides nanus TaxID=290746 RepID=A0A914DFW8_9BILA